MRFSEVASSRKRFRSVRQLRAILHALDPAADEFYVVTAESLKQIESAARAGVPWRVTHVGICVGKIQP